MNTRNRLCRMYRCSALALAIFAGIQAAPAQDLGTQRSYELPAGSLVDSLGALSEQSGLQIIYDSSLMAGRRAPAVSGAMTAADALRTVLGDSALEFEVVSERTVRIRARSEAAAPRTRQQTQSPGSDDEERVTGLPALMVRGARTLNADVTRTINDPQPYVIFDRNDIQKSGAINISDFFQKRLSSNTSLAPPGQRGEILGDRSSVNLRGLGEGQTLILIDGRRAAKTSGGFNAGQPDLNGLPLSAIERIEVLSSTASAIYGGAATGGVINVVLRRDYEGGEVSFSHDNSFDTDSAINRIDFAYGFAANEGRTQVMLNGSKSEANLMLQRDRDYIRRGREHMWRNNPDFLITSAYPPMGSVLNFKSASGQNLVLDDGTPLGSPISHVPKGYHGPQTDGGAALVANAGEFDFGFGPGGSYYAGGGSLLPASRVQNLSGSIRHSFSDRIDGFLEVMSSENNSRYPQGVVLFGMLPADHPKNPFQQDITYYGGSGQGADVAVTETKSERVSAGLIAQLSGNWSAAVDYTWSRSSLGYTFYGGLPTSNRAAILGTSYQPLSDIDASFDLSPYLAEIGTRGDPVTTYSHNPSLRVSGPVWTLPGGAAMLSAVLEGQYVDFTSGAQRQFPGRPDGLSAVFPPRSQDVESAYVELTVPVVGKSNELGWAKSLELQLAARYDRYESVNGSFVIEMPGMPLPPFTLVENKASEQTGLIGLKYSPIDGLTLRASYGTGFVPPEIDRLAAPTIYEEYNYAFVDPKRGNTVYNGTYRVALGGNPNLGPESSKTKSFGVIVQPESLPGFRASVDYTVLDKENNITSFSEQGIVDNEDYFPGRIVRGDPLPGDPAGWAGPVIFLDRSAINAATSHLEAIDAQLKYGFNTRGGAYVEFWGNGTWMISAEEQLSPAAPVTDRLGVSTGFRGSVPLRFKGAYGASVEKDSWTLGWSVRHFSSYYVADPHQPSSAPILAAQGNGGKVPRQILHDVYGIWRPALASGLGPRWSSWLENFEFNAGIRNVFNEKPEVDISNDYHFYSWLADYRLATYYVQVKYMF